MVELNSGRKTQDQKLSPMIVEFGENGEWMWSGGWKWSKLKSGQKIRDQKFFQLIAEFDENDERGRGMGQIKEWSEDSRSKIYPGTQ